MDRFLRNIVFRGVQKGDPKLPRDIFFVDDCKENLQSVCQGLSTAIALGINIRCFLYQPTHLARSKFDLDVLKMQVKTFLDDHLVLSDDEAKMAIDELLT